MTTDVKKILEDVLKERAYQDEKFGRQDHDDATWLAILTEEVGETSQAILHTRFGGSHAGRVREELVQTCAVALAWLECVDRRSV